MVRCSVRLSSVCNCCWWVFCHGVPFAMCARVTDKSIRWLGVIVAVVGRPTDEAGTWSRLSVVRSFSADGSAQRGLHATRVVNYSLRTLAASDGMQRRQHLNVQTFKQLCEIGTWVLQEVFEKKIVFLGFSVQRRRGTNLRPWKNIIYTILHGVSWKIVLLTR